MTLSEAPVDGSLRDGQTELLGEQGPLLGEPYTRQLDGELRSHLDGNAIRVTCWIASGRRIVLLMVFRKTTMRESREIERARRAFARCVSEAHTVDVHDGSWR